MTIDKRRVSGPEIRSGGGWCKVNISPAVLLFSLCAVLAGWAPAAQQQTWHLSKDDGFVNVAAEEQGGYLLAVSEVKRAVAEGQTAVVRSRLEQISEEYKQAAGADLHAFTEAEIAYSSGNYIKAVKLYDQFLNDYPESGFYESALERKYSIALGYLNGLKRPVLKFIPMPAYDYGQIMMNEIADRAGDAPISKRALVALAQSQKKRGKFLDEYETWAQVYNRWPTGEMGKKAQLGMAFALHSAYKGPKFDPATLASARTYYENINSRYSDLSSEYQIDAKLDLVDQQRAYKEYSTGMYYERTQSPDSAMISYRYVIETWPDSTAAMIAKERIDIITGKVEQKQDPKDFKRKMFDAGETVLDDWVAKIDIDWMLPDDPEE